MTNDLCLQPSQLKTRQVKTRQDNRTDQRPDAYIFGVLCELMPSLSPYLCCMIVSEDPLQYLDQLCDRIKNKNEGFDVPNFRQRVITILANASSFVTPEVVHKMELAGRKAQQADLKEQQQRALEDQLALNSRMAALGMRDDMSEPGTGSSAAAL